MIITTSLFVINAWLNLIRSINKRPWHLRLYLIDQATKFSYTLIPLALFLVKHYTPVDYQMIHGYETTITLVVNSGLLVSIVKNLDIMNSIKTIKGWFKEL